jgi:hypothetical protein
MKTPTFFKIYLAGVVLSFCIPAATLVYELVVDQNSLNQLAPFQSSLQLMGLTQMFWTIAFSLFFLVTGFVATFKRSKLAVRNFGLAVLFFLISYPSAFPNWCCALARDSGLLTSSVAP